MAGQELKIDDDYVTQMADFLEKRGNFLQDEIDKYLDTLGMIRDDAIIKGETANALDEFIGFAEVLREKISVIGENAKKAALGFITEVDEKDSYLF